MFTFLFLGLPGIADEIPEGPVPTVQAVTVESEEKAEPVFKPSSDKSTQAPNHPPISEIPPAWMPEPTDSKSDPDAPETVLIFDTLTGEVSEMPAGDFLEEADANGYKGVDGGYSFAPEDLSKSFWDMSIISNPEQFPFRMTCKLVMHFVDQCGADRYSTCSGSMKDAETVITAAHCVYARTATGCDIFDWADEIWVYPGWDGVGGQFNPPPTTVNNYGYARGTAFMAGSDYINNGNWDRDCGLIRVTRAVGMLTGWFGWTWGYSCGTIQGRTYYNTSFPAEGGCAPGMHTGSGMYHWGGTIDSCPGNQMELSTGGGGCFDTVWGGMSGSPMYWIDNDYRRVHAVCSTSNRSTVGRYCKLWEQFVLDMDNSFIPDSRGTSFDLQALNVNAEPASIQVGTSFSLMNFLATNPTNGTDSDTYTFRIYLSTNDNISTGDTLLDTQAFGYSFAAMSSVTVNMGLATIPNNTPPGSYWVGVILDSGTDGNYGNNDTDGWDAVPITVTPCPSQSAPSSVSASDGTYTNRVYVSWAAPSGATSYEVWRNTSSSTLGATRIADSVATTYYNDYTATPGTTYYYWVKANNICGNTSGFSSYNTGYRALTGTCVVPPSYDTTITPSIDWKTTSSSFFAQGCRVYRMYLYSDMGYDFSICGTDAVGGSYTGTGDGDFTMYDSGGTQLWYIDGTCSYNATTLGSAYDGWSPPSDGYYYIMVDDYYSSYAADFVMAFRLTGDHCYDPPTYDDTLTPQVVWQTTGDQFFVSGACRIYKMYLSTDNGYDFSACDNDSVGGSCDIGDADFTMYDSTGSQLWYLDGDSSCGYDASTLGTSLEEWVPPSNGEYYLKVSGYFGFETGYNMAYKTCPQAPTASNPIPIDGANDVPANSNLTWRRGAFGVLENTGSLQDDYAIAHITGLASMTASGVTWQEVANSTGEDLWGEYDVIYFSVSPYQDDYNNLITAVANGGALEQFASLGGVLVLNIAGNDGSQNDIAPGGLDYDRTYGHSAETFVSMVHPYVTGIGYLGGTSLTESMFDSWSSTDHGNLLNLPPDTTEILENSHGTSMIEYPWGLGKVIVSTLTFNWADAAFRSAEPFDNQLYYSMNANLTWVAPPDCVILDDFDRANNTNMGADWTEQNGDFSILGNMATSAGSTWALTTYNTDIGNDLCVDVIHNGLNSLQFAGLISGYADLANCILVKVQDNGGTGAFNRVYFYYGNGNSSFGNEILSPTFTSARMTTRLVGDAITVEFDTNFDGIIDQTYSRSGISTVALGTASGLCGYNDPLMDNFGIAPPSMSSPPSPTPAKFDTPEDDDKRADSSLAAAGPRQKLTKKDVRQAARRYKLLKDGIPNEKLQRPLDSTTDVSSKSGVLYKKVEVGRKGNLDQLTVLPLYIGPKTSPTTWSPAASKSLVIEDFPSADSNVVASIGFIDSTQIGYFWSVARGDEVQETFATGIPSIGQAVFDFVIPTNGLGIGNVVNWDVLINGVKIGDFVIADQQIGPEHLEFIFPPIPGPIYTVRLEVTNEVAGGGGAHTLGYAGIHAGTVQLIQSTAEGCDDLDLGHPSVTPSLIGGIGGERSMAVDVDETVTVISIGILAEMGLATDLTVTIRDVTGTVRGSILDSTTIAVAPGGPAFYDVPFNFTFLAGLRYDIGFSVTADNWGASQMEIYSFNNAGLDPLQGYQAGPFTVLDGGEWSGVGYANTMMPHVRMCAVPACETTYDVYLGTDNPPATLVASGLTLPTYDPTPVVGDILDSCTSYYWQITSKNCCDESAGPVWTFNTEFVGDLNGDNVITFPDFVLFSLGWKEPVCTEPDWCNGLDLNYSGQIDELDLKHITDQWLTSCSL